MRDPREEESSLKAETIEAPRSEKSSFRPDIQGLRAIAVVLVILVHASVPGFEGGYIGVDVFFVISGFVITGLLLRQPERGIGRNLAHFYVRRIRRIVPAATLTLVTTVVAAYALLGANFAPQLLGDVRWAALFGANFRLINTGSNYFIPGVAPSLVTHFWSLAVEEQFYLVYPLIVFSLIRLAPATHRIRMLAGFLILAIALSSWWSYHLTPVNPVAAYYSPFTRFWQLALGGLVALAPVAWARRSPLINSIGAGIALLAIGLAALRLNAYSTYPGLLAWWPSAASAVLLFTGQASLRGAPASWLSWRPLRYVGDISYSLYLWHFAWLMLPLQLVHPISSPGARIAEVAGATVCAILSYHFVENPVRHSNLLARDAWATGLLLAICLVLSWDSTFVIGRLAHVS
ncbi:MAG: acyltransferase [Acidimicrobiaceae bacterium]|nr:acyltransferase [Acidimicrobiaceae bacterium]